MKNKQKGFSLIELVIIIAILAILIAVLAPSLMTYTERSRAQKDVTTMDEVVNAVQLAMADQKCYDEMLRYSCSNNFITYTDSSGNYGQVVADGEFWAPDGSGRATTITFNPTRKGNETYYVLETGLVNDMTYGNGSVAENRVMQGAQIQNNQCYFKNASLNGGEITGYTYNRVRQIIGDSTITTSATYANSSFTIFIKFNQKDGVTVADVNGSFNGTNLTADAESAKGSGTSTYDPTTKDPITTVTSPGKVSSNYSNTALQGGGSFTPDYKQETPPIEEEEEDDAEYIYYSKMSTALHDIANEEIGANADVEASDKANAVAAITIKNDKPYVKLLQDHTTLYKEGSITLYGAGSAIIDLNGHMWDCQALGFLITGSGFVDSTNGKGTLKATANFRMDDIKNSMFPIAIDTYTYKFVNVNVQSRIEYVNADQKGDFKLIFTVNNSDMDSEVFKYIKQYGAEALGIKIGYGYSYNGNVSGEFTYNEAQIKSYLNGEFQDFSITIGDSYRKKTDFTIWAHVKILSSKCYLVSRDRSVEGERYKMSYN